MKTMRMTDEQEEIFEADDTHPETISNMVTELTEQAKKIANEIDQSVEIVCNDYVVKIVYPETDENVEFNETE